MSKILNGRELRDKLSLELKNKIDNMAQKPKLVIIQIGDLDGSNSYIKMKKEFGEKLGVDVIHQQYPNNISDQKVVNDIKEYNEDFSVNGIMVQLPIPERMDKEGILGSIDPKKDVDGLTMESINSIFNNKEGFLPATTKGIITILEQNSINFKGKKVCIIGESTLVGRPTALAFMNRKATVTVCNIDTIDLEEQTKKADILIVAIGQPKYITEKYVNHGQVIIDVGINITDDGKIVGDVDTEKVKDIVDAITPVPGGVGPMTVFSLFENLV